MLMKFLVRFFQCSTSFVSCFETSGNIIKINTEDIYKTYPEIAKEYLLILYKAKKNLQL